MDCCEEGKRMRRAEMSVLPEMARVHLGMALGICIMKAGNDMLLDFFEKYPDVAVPSEWPFKLSLDEQGAELNQCQVFYRDLAIMDVVNAILDQMYPSMDTSKGNNDA
jgi:hypothetical protein